MTMQLGFKDINDPYWRSLTFILAGDEKLFSNRHSLIEFRDKSINSDTWFTGSFSDGEQRLLGLSYNLFTNRDFFEFDNGDKYFISSLDIFSGLDQYSYELAKNAIDIRLKY